MPYNFALYTAKAYYVVVSLWVPLNSSALELQWVVFCCGTLE